MTTLSERPIPASSPDLPPVERRAAIPPGFRAGGLAAGIKASGRPDLAVVVSTTGPAAAAAVFTPNTFAAAPVRLSKAHLAATSGDSRGGFGWAEAIISTSGSANAATGAAGDADQVEVASMLAEATGVAIERTLLLSTGIIGTRLPLDKVRAGLAALVPTLGDEDNGLLAAAQALRTTDSVVKVATTPVDLPDGAGRPVRVTVSGICKGVGMIHPRMATMLSIVLTDATVAPDLLWGMLRAAAARTWAPLFGVVGLTLVIANFGSGLGAQIGAARLLFGMGRSNALPKSFFGMVDEKNRVPRNNVIFVGIIALIGSFFLSFGRGIELLNFGALIAFMVRTTFW